MWPHEPNHGVKTSKSSCARLHPGHGSVVTHCCHTCGAQVAREAALHEAELAEAKQQGAGHYRALLQREGELSALQRACDELSSTKVPRAPIATCYGSQDN